MRWNSRKTTATLLPLFALFLAPLSARAQESPAPAVTPYRFFGGVEPLMSQQTQVVDLLAAGKWQEAQKLAQQQFLVLAGYVEKYPGLAGTALALEALADAGLGNESSAVCRWNAAQKVDPKLANADLTMFGAAGALLKNHPYTAPGEAIRVPEGDQKTLKREVQRPELLSRSPLLYPEAARRAKIEGKVIVEAIIEKDGSLSNLKTLQGQPMGLDLAAVESLCGWRFKPATLKGEPVKVYYVLTVNFKVEKGPPPLISNP